MIKKGHKISQSNVLVMGITFKENCTDIRNTRVIDVVEELHSFGCNVDVYDPWANPREVREEYGIEMIKEKPNKVYDAVVVAVAHNEFKEMDIKSLCGETGVLFDIKSILEKELVDGRL
jgi:UDP-N-acetyl-D-galactosamine dehydrogenase